MDPMGEELSAHPPQNQGELSPQSSLAGYDVERLCLRNLIACTEERVYFKDRESRFVLVSAGFVNALGNGGALSSLVGKSDFDLFSAPHATEALEDEQRIIRTGEPIVGKIERETFEDRGDSWVATTKLPLRDDRGEIVGTFGISRDVTAQVEAQHALARQALEDPVTGVANRIALMDRLSRALASLERTPGQVAVLFVDLDDFKTVNDRLGHDAGDQVLTTVARRLVRVARRTDTVARFGGDEFVLLLTELRSAKDVRVICDRVLHALRQPLKVGHGTKITGSAGAAVSRDPDANPAELVQKADLAMYSAKRAGRDRFKLYSSAMHALSATTRDIRSPSSPTVETGC
jgi:diguanylate cyclase (GGDEF)-like protein/PAS domain S-box-containing protein